MKNKNTLLVIVLVFVLLLGGAYVLYDRLGQEVTAEQMIVHSTPVPTAGPSPEETLPKTQPEAETETAEHEEPEDILAPDFHVYDKDGNTVHLSDFFGKPIVLNFWASWCGPCKMLAPTVDKLAEKYDGKVIVGKVDVDEEQELARQFGVMSIPTVVLFKDGKEVQRTVGVQPQAAFERLVDDIL